MERGGIVAGVCETFLVRCGKRSHTRFLLYSRVETRERKR